MFSLLSFAVPVSGQETALPPVIKLVSYNLHCLMHSAIIAEVVTLLLWAAYGSQRPFALIECRQVPLRRNWHRNVGQAHMPAGSLVTMFRWVAVSTPRSTLTPPLSRQLFAVMAASAPWWMKQKLLTAVSCSR
jgi:hypothetical protein